MCPIPEFDMLSFAFYVGLGALISIVLTIFAPRLAWALMNLLFKYWLHIIVVLGLYHIAKFFLSTFGICLP